MTFRNWLLNIFSPDWIAVSTDYGKWDVNTDFGLITKRCCYELVYSKRLNKYKINLYGYKPRLHSIYPYVIEDFNKIIKNHE